MCLLRKNERKINEQIDEITFDTCGKTLKDYTNSKDKKLCNECYS